MSSLSQQLSKAEKGTLEEIIREAESYLAVQLQAAIAADQRALAFAGLLAAATVVIAGAGGALLIQEMPELALGWLCIGLAIVFALASVLALLAGRPTEFHYPGNCPSEWTADVESKKPIAESLAEQAQHYDENIKTNNAIMKLNNRFMTAGLATATFGLVASVVTGAVILANRTLF